VLRGLIDRLGPGRPGCAVSAFDGGQRLPKTDDQFVFLCFGEMRGRERRRPFMIARPIMLVSWDDAPSAICTTCSALLASARLCVTRISVVPRSWLTFRSNAMISLSVSTSRSEVGSSASSRIGLLNERPRNHGARCSPADISDG